MVSGKYLTSCNWAGISEQDFSELVINLIFWLLLLSQHNHESFIFVCRNLSPHPSKRKVLRVFERLHFKL